MADENLQQILTANPRTTINNSDIIYLFTYPYSTGPAGTSDAAILADNLKTSINGDISFSNPLQSLTTGGNFTLFTAISSLYNFISPNELRIVASLIANKTINPNISIGTNSPDYDNIFPATTLTFSATADFQIIPILNGSGISLASSGTPIVVKINTPATADNYAIKVTLKGDFV